MRIYAYTDWYINSLKRTVLFVFFFFLLSRMEQPIRKCPLVLCVKKLVLYDGTPWPVCLNWTPSKFYCWAKKKKGKKRRKEYKNTRLVFARVYSCCPAAQSILLVLFFYFFFFCLNCCSSCWVSSDKLGGWNRNRDNPLLFFCVRTKRFHKGVHAAEISQKRA